jgi:hypothetical protein
MYLKAAAKRSDDDRRLRADDHLVNLKLAILAKESEVAELSGLHKSAREGNE